MTALGCCFIIHPSLPPKGRESASAISRIPALAREPFNEAVKFAVAKVPHLLLLGKTETASEDSTVVSKKNA